MARAVDPRRGQPFPTSVHYVPDLATILVSAAVATTVTLLIEFAAKPRLEVRKERILRSARADEDTRVRLAVLASQLDQAPTELRLSAREAREVMVELDEGIRYLFNRRGDWTARLPAEIEGLVSFEMGFARSLLGAAGTAVRLGLTDEHETDARGRELVNAILKELQGFFVITAHFLGTSTWRPLKRRSLRREAIARLAVLHARPEALDAADAARRNAP